MKVVRCPKCRHRFRVRRGRSRRRVRPVLPLSSLLDAAPRALVEELVDADFKVLPPPRLGGPRT